MIIPSVLVHVPFYHSDEDTIGNVSLILVIVQCVVLVLSILPTEHALKKNFMMTERADRICRRQKFTCREYDYNFQSGGNPKF